MTRARGFSLIEVMSSVALFSVGLIATLAAYNNAAVQLEHQRHTTAALHAAEAVLEDLLLLRAGDATLDTGTQCFGREGDRMACGTSALYTVSWTGSAHPSIAGVRIVTVTASWFEGVLGQPRSLTLETQRD